MTFEIQIDDNANTTRRTAKERTFATEAAARADYDSITAAECEEEIGACDSYCVELCSVSVDEDGESVRTPLARKTVSE